MTSPKKSTNQCSYRFMDILDIESEEAPRTENRNGLLDLSNISTVIDSSRTLNRPESHVLASLLDLTPLQRTQQQKQKRKHPHDDETQSSPSTSSRRRTLSTDQNERPLTNQNLTGGAATLSVSQIPNQSSSPYSQIPTHGARLNNQNSSIHQATFNQAPSQDSSEKKYPVYIILTPGQKAEYFVLMTADQLTKSSGIKMKITESGPILLLTIQQQNSTINQSQLTRYIAQLIRDNIYILQQSRKQYQKLILYQQRNQQLYQKLQIIQQALMKIVQHLDIQL
uniref:Uncharacterized protein n=1 Tax=Metapenaeus joyneri majanivirus TaxID=2984280 RepID=A0A9C7CDW4_9VIRU|nr:MAG: hypothetical protein [Metapenaeus joyneri majanivirus]